MTLFTPPHLLNSVRWRGMRVGILGGSFNPPHGGHIHISHLAMETLQLDCIWWMVSPGNPFKHDIPTIPYKERLAQCRALNHDPRVVITDLEQQTGTIRTVDTFEILTRRFLETEFVMLGGMDIAHQIPTWSRWQRLTKMTAMAFLARPPETSLVRANTLRLSALQNHYVLARPRTVDLSPGNCYWILQSRLDYTSSTKLRNNDLIQYITQFS